MGIQESGCRRNTVQEAAGKVQLRSVSPLTLLTLLISHTPFLILIGRREKSDIDKFDGVTKIQLFSKESAPSAVGESCTLSKTYLVDNDRTNVGILVTKKTIMN